MKGLETEAEVVTLGDCLTDVGACPICRKFSIYTTGGGNKLFKHTKPKKIRVMRNDFYCV